MKSSPAKGFSAIEIVSVLICITIISAIVYLKGFEVKSNDLIARATLAHIKLMVDYIEKQKRELGAYPMSLQAMVDKNEYLRPDGNSKGYTSEEELKTPWNGPYFTGHHVSPYLNGFHYYRYFKISLDNIHPGMTGSLRKHHNDNKILIYTVSREDANEAAGKFHPIAEKIIYNCNGSDYNRVALRQSQSHYSTYGNIFAPCAYDATDGKITDVTYYLAPLD